MTLQQKVFAVFLSLLILGLILHLVKKRRLREEYAWLWLLTGAVILLLVLWYDLLLFLTDLIGAVTATTTLFLFRKLECLRSGWKRPPGAEEGLFIVMII